MNTRLKKLVGTVLFVSGTALFYFFVITVAIARLPGTPVGVHLLFYLIATLIWFFLAGLLVRWMQKPARTSLHKN
jgi:Na+/phosphate symporter